MDNDLQYFLRLSNQVNESQIQDLRDEIIVQPSKKKEEKSKKKMPVKEPKPEKANKIRVVTLEAAPKNEEEVKQEFNEDEEYGGDSYDENGSENAEDNYKFSAIKVPVHPDLSMKKGKNPYQKLREARRKEAIDAQDPNSGLKNLRIAASTGKLPATSAQIEQSMKKKQKEKQKKYEKKLEKEARDKNNDKKNKNKGSGNKNFKNKMKNNRPNFKKSKK